MACAPSGPRPNSNFRKLRERADKLEVEEAEIRLRLEQTVEQVRQNFDCEPDAAVAAPVPDVPDGTSLPGAPASSSASCA